MKLKEGASLKGVQWQMFYAAIIIEGVLQKSGYECVITSGTDGQHGVGPSKPGKADKTLHDDGLALDIRNRDIPVPQWEPLRRDIAAALGNEYDVVLETKPPHFHVEFDPPK